MLIFAEKGGYEDFMLKEINEQPKAIKDTMTSRIMEGKEVTLDDISITKEYLDNVDRVYIVACGTTYHLWSNWKIRYRKIS